MVSQFHCTSWGGRDILLYAGRTLRAERQLCCGKMLYVADLQCCLLHEQQVRGVNGIGGYIRCLGGACDLLSNAFCVYTVLMLVALCVLITFEDVEPYHYCVLLDEEVP